MWSLLSPPRASGSTGWLPISFRDWAGNEIVRVYSDEYGTYNALLPSTYTVNVPSPSGVSPNMITLVLNDPTMPDPNDPTGRARIPDPFYNPNFSTTPWTFMYYPGSVSYLDTPIVPIGGLVGFPNNQLDVEPPSNTPVIKSVNGPAGGPYVADINDLITITSMGTAVQVPDPLSIGYAATATITRNYGFGGNSGSRAVLLIDAAGNMTSNTIVSWNTDTITCRLPAGTAPGAYQLLVRRNNNVVSPIGVTLTYGGAGAVHHVSAVEPTELDPMPTPIQDAIDAAAPGDLVLVHEGNYFENPVMHKPVRLQGSGAGTVIHANPNPLDRVDAWHAFIRANLGGDPFIANELPGVMVYSTDENAFATTGARIDGFQIVGAIAGGGITLWNNAHNTRISNNRITGNQGSYGGGITIGVRDALGVAGILYNNTNVVIDRNQILQNGGRDGSGGIAIYTGATGYKILNNDILGNFCRGNGGGIGHEGLSPNGLIANNRIAFNEVFYGVLVGGDGGGIFISGQPVAGGLGTGAGSVTILKNLIQGNIAGSGHGGGIRVSGFNGLDVEAAPGNSAQWYALDIVDNIIVNNLAAWAGGGISLQDVTRARIVHNTVARNDSTATSKSAFQPDSINSDAQVAGIACHQYSLLLGALMAPATHTTPDIANNIIHRNRSYFWNGTTSQIQPRGAGNNAFWDLGVPEQPGTTLNPRYCLLNVASGGVGNIIANSGNGPQFVQPYFNTLHTAVVIDEAGNNISVRLEQVVTGTGNAAVGNYRNYHINTTSPAVNTALAGVDPVVGYDYDGQTRPIGVPDMGADETSSAATTVVLATTAPAAGALPAGTPPPVNAPPGAGTPPGVPAPIAFEPMPADTDGVDTDGDGIANNDHYYKNVTGGDGFAKMADGNELYTFSFFDITATTLATNAVDPTAVQNTIMKEGKLKAEIPAPSITLKEGQKFYLDLSNVGMLMRPDLFDPHSVHFHGFPQAASIFDGEPFASAVINVGATLRYFYNIVEPGTYIWHCHVEATEHMEMGMLGSLWVEPKQNNADTGTYPNHTKGVTKFAYNDGDGSTLYHKEYPLQISAFDRNFHEQHILVQPLPFSDLDESYPMINGRGYPDTINPDPITNTKVQEVLGLDAEYPAQKQNALITATAGQRVLLRLSNVSLSDFHNLTVLGIPMRVIAKDAKLLRGPNGADLTYQASSLSIGPGETADVILDTTGVAPGTYFLYDARLNHLCNDLEDFGGMMTEIRIQ